jgi:hypothetical protein
MCRDRESFDFNSECYDHNILNETEKTMPTDKELNDLIDQVKADAAKFKAAVKSNPKVNPIVWSLPNGETFSL